jgi:hypothetical protein
VHFIDLCSSCCNHTGIPHDSRERLPAPLVENKFVHALTALHSLLCRIARSMILLPKFLMGQARGFRPRATNKYHLIGAQAPHHWESIPIVSALFDEEIAR